MIDNKETISSRYKKMAQEKNFYMASAKECCKYTLPTLLSFFEEGNKNYENVKAPYQSIGARGVNNLSSKLLTTITPVSMPMFKFVIDDEVLKNQLSNGDLLKMSEIDEALTQYGESIQRCIKASGDYAQMFEVWQLLLVSGNVLIYDPDDNSNIRVYSLRDYVLKRDRSGGVIEIIVKESVSKESLSISLLEKLSNTQNNTPSISLNEKYYDLYTQAKKVGDYFYVNQECGGILLEDSSGVYPVEACPFIPIRMYAGSGENYSRSFVSNYLGDLKSIDVLSQGTIEGAAMAAKHLYLVRPDGLTEIKDIEDTENGGVIYGRSEDIGVMQSGKGTDLRIVSEEASKIEKRLSQGFLLLDGGIRNAERVTREEIKAIATELENALGGVYSVMCHSFQLPYIKRKIWKLQQLGKISPLNKNIIPIVVTGFEALGLNGDKEKLLEFMTILNQVFGSNILNFIDYDLFIKRLANTIGIDTKGLIKPYENVSNQLNNAQKQELIFKLLEKILPTFINKAENLQNVIDNMIGNKKE